MRKGTELKNFLADDLQCLINQPLHYIGKLKCLTSFTPTNINYSKLTSEWAQNI